MSAAGRRATDVPIPVTILTGFLGAGKTTLLNRWLRQPSMAASAVVINEFGAIGIDHLLVEQAAGDMVLLTSGCLCCAARGDILTALAGLVGRRAAGAADFDRIIVETSGLADPAPILNAALVDPALWGSLRINAVVAVVDAGQGAAAIGAFPEALAQIAVADLILLTKTDLPGAAELGPMAAWLRGLNPVADIRAATENEADDLSPLGISSVARVMPSPGVAVHHSAGIATACLRGGTLDTARLQAFLMLLLERYGANLLRLKGIVALREDSARPAVLHAVRHLLHPVQRLEAWPDADRASRIVVITQDLGHGAVEALWDAFFAAPAIDRPDAAALTRGFEGGAGLFG